MKESGHLPDVTALIVTKETDVTRVLRGPREKVARNVPLVSKGMNVSNVLLVSRGEGSVSRLHTEPLRQ